MQSVDQNDETEDGEFSLRFGHSSRLVVVEHLEDPIVILLLHLELVELLLQRIRRYYRPVDFEEILFTGFKIEAEFRLLDPLELKRKVGTERGEMKAI